MAPETINGDSYEPYGADIWSLGVLLYTFLIGKPPFNKNDDPNKLKEAIKKGEYSTNNIQEPVANLIKQMLQVNPNKRITLDKILDHEWFETPPKHFVVFKDDEMIKIERECIYKDIYINDPYRSNVDGKENIGNLNFTERYLESTLNEYMKNVTEESIIKSPYNTTAENAFEREDSSIDTVIMKENIINFDPRVREIDRRYEYENNCKIDHGIYNETKASFQSKSRSILFSQKSRTRTFTSKRESSKKSGSIQGIIEDEEEEKVELFNLFGKSGIQQIEIEEHKYMKLDYNLVYALRRFGYPYDYTIRWILNKEINYWTAFMALVKNSVPS